MKQNFQLEMEKLIDSLGGERKTLLLHSCCAPCSSYVLETLCRHFDITVDYYNPNIDTAEEYEMRAKEQCRFACEAALAFPVKVHVEPYRPSEFYEAVKGLEQIPEGGERCFACYRLRLEQAAKLCREGNYDYFCTTLSISPHKNAQKLNEIGLEMAEKYGVKWLFSDFKKKNGFRRSTELSDTYDMYRQDYCGCVFSRKERLDAQKATAQANSEAKTECQTTL